MALIINISSFGKMPQDEEKQKDIFLNMFGQYLTKLCTTNPY